MTNDPRFTGGISIEKKKKGEHVGENIGKKQNKKKMYGYTPDTYDSGRQT